MKRHFLLLKEFIRACLIEEFEYRTQLLANVALTLFGASVSILAVSVFFYRASEVGGWRFYEVLVLLGLFEAVQGFISLCLEPNMSRLVQHIRRGTLDYVLLKPVDSQFFVSFRHLVFWRAADMAVGLAIALYGVFRSGALPGPSQWLGFILVFGASLMIVYALWIGMMTFSFWAVKVDNLSFLFNSLFETARYPSTVYRGLFRIFLTTVFPVALITTVPASALLGKMTPGDGVAAVLLGILFLAATRAFWRYALRHYTSASS